MPIEKEPLAPSISPVTSPVRSPSNVVADIFVVVAASTTIPYLLIFNLEEGPYVAEVIPDSLKEIVGLPSVPSLFEIETGAVPLNVLP